MKEAIQVVNKSALKELSEEQELFACEHTLCPDCSDAYTKWTKATC